MSDDLAAFFAKKANKGKKKGVIKLQEVTDQLERRAKIQDEIDEFESKPSEEALSNKPRNNTENEDSEWLEFDERPTLPSAVKEMEDFDIESEEEEKRSSAEPTKTWNVNNNESNEATPPPVMSPKETKYVTPNQKKTTRNQFDINNEMLFPTLGNASNVEKELKKEEEANIRQELEEKRKKEENQRRNEEARLKRYNAPRGIEGGKRGEQGDGGATEADSANNWRSQMGQQDGGSPRKQQPEKRQVIEAPPPGESESVENWRSQMGQQDGGSPRKQQPEKRQVVEPPPQGESDSAENWRSQMGQQDGGSPRKQQPEKRQVAEPPPQGESDSAENWRSVKTTSTPKVEPEIAPQPMETNKPPAGSKKAYVPPHLRQK